MEEDEPVWGAYQPKKETWLLRLLISLNLSRGALCRRIRKTWKERAEFVDVERRGIRYRLSIRNNTTDSKILTSSKFYEKEELQELAKRASGARSVFVDIGANTGYYSLSLASQFDLVLAVEPNPPTLRRLRFNVACNKFDSIEIVPLCVGPEGEIPFYSTGDLGSSSTVAIEEAAIQIQVKSRPLLDILAEYDVARISALKIDVEGAEDKALLPFFKEAERQRWPLTIVMEDCNSQDWSEDVIAYLKSIGYQEIKKTRGNLILDLTKA